MFVKATSFACASLWAACASAQFATAPDGAASDVLEPEIESSPAHESAFRASVGPAVRVSSQSTAGGLSTGINLGRQSGLHLSAIWTQAAQDSASAQYGADLWLALPGLGQVRPIVGAGAALVREPGVSNPDEPARPSQQFGVATVRAALEYLVRLESTDARVSLEGVGAIPAVKAHAEHPWLTLMSSIHLGF